MTVQQLKISPLYTLQCGEGNGTPLQYSCLENPMDGGAWWAAVHEVAKSCTWLSNFTFTFHFHALEKEMATHSSVLAWRIPRTAEPGGLLSMGSHRVKTRLKRLSSSSSSSVLLCIPFVCSQCTLKSPPKERLANCIYTSISQTHLTSFFPKETPNSSKEVNVRK